jgi:hypothetical protein
MSGSKDRCHRSFELASHGARRWFDRTHTVTVTALVRSNKPGKVCDKPFGVEGPFVRQDRRMGNVRAITVLGHLLSCEPSQQEARSALAPAAHGSVRAYSPWFTTLVRSNAHGNGYRVGSIERTKKGLRYAL